MCLLLISARCHLNLIDMDLLLEEQLVNQARMVRCLVNVCKGGTVQFDSPDSMLGGIKTIIVACLKFVNNKQLLADVAPDRFIDWEYVDAQKSRGLRNILGDVNMWLQLLPLLSFVRPSDSTLVDVIHEFQLFQCMHSSLKHCVCHDAKPTETQPLTFDDICKLSLLVNVEGLSSANAVELYTSQRLHRVTTTETAAVTSALADMRLTQEDYTRIFKYMLSIMTLDSGALAKLIEQHNETERFTRNTWHTKICSQRKSRVSLRAILQSKGVDYATTYRGDSEGSLSDAASMANGFDKLGLSVPLNVFCTTIRFPNSMSRVLRLRCYLHACCGHLYEHGKYTDKLVNGNIAMTINCNPVHSPDVHSLCQAIETLVLNRAPFKELVYFRDKCFTVLSANHWNRLPLTSFLHLYVCAYQKRDLWKMCWKNFFPIMSTQISKEVEAFVSKHAFAVDDFIRIMQTSTPFVQ